MEKNYVAMWGSDLGVRIAQLALTRTCAEDMLWDYIKEFCHNEDRDPEIYRQEFDRKIRNGLFTFYIYKHNGYDFFQIYRLGD